MTAGDLPMVNSAATACRVWPTALPRTAGRSRRGHFPAADSQSGPALRRPRRGAPRGTAGRRRHGRVGSVGPAPRGSGTARAPAAIRRGRFGTLIHSAADDGGAARPIRVLLADDQALIRGAFAALLGLESDMRVVAQVGTGDEVVPAALRSAPDVALLDVQMPGMDGIAAAASLADQLPTCRVIILTTFGRPGYLRRAGRRWSG